MKKQIIVLVGPTAVGKSDIAAELAKRIGAEIISCDSMQVYRGLDILTNKPSCEARRAVRHHLINTLTPSCEFSAADFRRRAVRLIKRIQARKKVPLFVGGTGLYVKALIDGLFKAPKKDDKIRERLFRYAKRYGAERLYSRLEATDPDSAKNIHPNDLRRVVRALEIFELTKTPMSKLKKNTKGLGSEYSIVQFGLRMPLKEVYGRIDARVKDMFNSGLVYEVKDVIKKNLSKTASKALGIKEVAGYINGEYDLDEAKRLLGCNTRRYARRQMTWFRADCRILWIDINKYDTPKDIADKIWKRLSSL